MPTKKMQVGSHGRTGAIATGTAVNHNCPGAPTSIVVTVGVTGVTDIYVDTITATQFTIHFAGGGNKAFDWVALV